MLLSIAIVLLAGISIAQYQQLNKVSAMVTKLKANITGDAETDAFKYNNPHHQSDAAASNTPVVSNKILTKPAPPKPVSPTQYWISTDYSDEKPHGFAGWLELVPGGHFILEHCFAPDYGVAVSAVQDHYQSPTCKTMADTRIDRISDTEMILQGNRSVTMSLDVSTEIHTLSLELDEHKIELTPGQKNILWEGLSSLPSIKKAHEVAWEKHEELRGKL